MMQTNTVTAKPVTLYRVRTKHEWATICLDEWPAQRTKDGNYTSYGGEILIHSSLGSYCNSWVACGVPFKQFLLQIDCDYFMKKCIGRDYRKYDGEATYKNIVSELLQRRRRGEVDIFDAQLLYNELHELRDHIGSSLDEMVQAINGLRERARRKDFDWLTSEPWEFAREMDCPQAREFWAEIWPHFTAQLRSELQQDEAA